MSLDFSKLAEKINEEARLVILQSLSVVPNGSLHGRVISEILKSVRIERNRDWLVTQLEHLAGVGGIVLETAGDDKVAVLTRDGVEHLERTRTLSGVKRPDLGV